MPGINILVNFNNNTKELDKKFISAQNSMLHNQRYTNKTIFKHSGIYIGYSKYEEYPIRIIETPDYLIVIEGKIYNKKNPVVKSELLNISNTIHFEKRNTNKILRDWTLSVDGDYIVLIMDKRKGFITIFNDILGRLPIYYFNNTDMFILSREVKFLTHFVENIIFDKQGIAEYLIFGYPLSDRTLLDRIYRLPPANKILIDINSKNVKFSYIYTSNLENKVFSGKPIKKLVNELSELFLSATKGRVDTSDDFKNILSLSGGLDSRCVGAALKKENISFVAVTNNSNNMDVEIAENVAKIIGIEWKKFNVRENNLEDIEHLITIKDGLVYAGWSFMLPFYYQIKKALGNKIIYFTGDGGDKVLPDLTPEKQLNSINALFKYIINNNAIFSLEEISAIAKIEKNEIKDNIIRVLEKYPEKNLNQKYVHFLVFERGFKWLFEGEDRNRFYFWSVAPFFASPVLLYAMNIPDKSKKWYSLYKNFLSRLSPELASIKNAKWNVPITSKKKIFYFLLKDVYRSIPFSLRRWLNNSIREKSIFYKSNKELFGYISNIVETSKIASKNFSKDDIKKILNRRLNKNQFHNLLTILRYMHKFDK